MPSIPLKSQLAIRDHWTSPTSPLQTSLQSLQSLLGHPLTIDPEWPLLIAELDPFYADKGNLVAIVAGCVQVWAKSMTELLDDEANEAWTETVLEKVPSRMCVYLDVSASEVASTGWLEKRGGFVVSLPKKQVVQPGELYPVYKGGLLKCFEVGEKPHLAVRPKAGDGDGAAGEDWVSMEVDAARGKAIVVEKPRGESQVSASVVEFLPSVESLPRPDLLFLQPSYYLTMVAGRQSIELQCSHSPSLQLVADYFKRWCRVNHSDTRSPPVVEITLHQSAFGLGEMFDRLTLGTENTRYTAEFQVTAPMIAAFIERILGYKRISEEGPWTFRRDTKFKAL